MPVTISRSVTIIEKSGNKIILTDGDQVSPETRVILVCDSPRCSARNGGKPTGIEWVEETAKADISSLPADFSRIIKVHPDPLNSEYAVFFCSAQCAKDYFTYAYVRPKTGKERAEEIQKTAELGVAVQNANTTGSSPLTNTTTPIVSERPVADHVDGYSESAE